MSLSAIWEKLHGNRPRGEAVQFRPVVLKIALKPMCYVLIVRHVDNNN